MSRFGLHPAKITCVALGVIVVVATQTTDDTVSTVRRFPSGFVFGTGTSAYQVEGAFNESGKGLQVWDYITHNTPVSKGDTGDVACDSYNKYLEDVQMVKNLHVHQYKFSLSWSRILPRGTVDSINQAGVDYYNNLIDALIEAGVEPLVVIYHWDTPISIFNNGGVNNPSFIRLFEEYSNLVFSLFGDRVKHWVTFNEPKNTCGIINQITNNYIETIPMGFVEYECARNVLVAHANVYHLYKNKYKLSQNGKISITLNSEYSYPASNSSSDIAAADRYLQFELGWFASPLYTGDWPRIMKTTISNNSERQGFSKSRLPEFTIAEKLKILGSIDYLTFNHYTSNLASSNVLTSGPPSRTQDIGVLTVKDPSWQPSGLDRIKVVAQGFRRVLKWLKTNYGDIEIRILENGYPGDDDEGRINYIKVYNNALLDAIEIDKVRITGYFYWSLMDSFEWADGYRVKFGLYNVDHDDPDKTRTPKPSVEFFRNVIDTNSIEVVPYE